MDSPNVKQEETPMTYADQKLVDSVKADPSPKNLGDMVTEVYKMNVGALNSIECLTTGQKLLTDAHTELVKAVEEIKTQIKDEIHPAVTRLSNTESRAKFYFNTFMTVTGICGMAIASWVWLKAPDAAWVASLNEPKIRQVAQEEAKKRDDVIKDELGKQTATLYSKLDENAHKIESVRVEFRDTLSTAFATHQNWHVTHPRPTKQTTP